MQRAPARDERLSAQEARVLLRQTDGLYVVPVLRGAVQDEHGHVKSVRLGREAEVGMEAHLDHGEDLVGQTLEVRVEDVVS